MPKYIQDDEQRIYYVSRVKESFPMQLFRKSPTEVSDYTFDWSKWLGTETITSSTWVLPGDFSQPQSASFTTKTTTLWLGGGNASVENYEVTNRIVTSGGRTQERTMRIWVVEI
jgi:hypothetical protein